MDADETEACGRCSMTAVVDAVNDGEERRDVLGESRIEVPEDELRVVAAPQALLGRAKRRLDELATALTYGR